MSWAVLLLLALPFVTAVLTFAAGHRAEGATRGVTVGGAGLAFVLAWVVAVPRLGEAAPLRQVYVDTAAVRPPIELSVDVDQLSAVMLLLAHTVAFLVQVYSLGYLHDDPRYPSYAALVAVFTGAMSVVVTADDLWLLLIGWELMGACSYFLIAHHWEQTDARAGAVKAFLMTRTADLGLLFAIIWLGGRFDSYRISTILEAVENGGFGRDELWLPALLIVAAVVGKSAQFPLHTWLPDAMPGPTPISALIHAATMVAAGVFLVARMLPLFLTAPSALVVLALVAAGTMVVSAGYALVSDDLKRVLAWSTVSQLAYMFGALAVGAYAAGILHLLAHGAFKALLFLSAGAVVHAVGTTSMAGMGGLRDKLPDTFAPMTIGFAALAGVVPMAGFFTKDAAMGAVWDAAREGDLVWPWVSWLLFAAMVLTAMLTVAYSLRAWLRVFFGAAPSGGAVPAGGDVRQPPASMTVPLYLLVVPTLLGGLLVASPEVALGEGDYHLLHPGLAVLTTVLVALTAAGVWVLWQRRDRHEPWPVPAAPVPAVDRAYDAAVVRPVLWLARGVRAGDRDVIDGYADGAGAAARGMGWALRRAQSGNVQAYLMVVVLGACLAAVAAGVAG